MSQTSWIFPELPFLQRLLEVFPLASDDVKARSVLRQASKSEIIEDDLLNRQLDNSCEETKDFTSSSSIQNTRSTVISCSLIFLELVLETH
ncbi:hypothetical protein NC653_011944 [Populus alba x Populus x berolinensis]|uniref:Uncharacterized protein n=1 Tax=Populus alba x Populus x berolinensis TaxID=444605 RepID=A0AAD6W774_9ROSI|nr:hypothetical protein NC653_011944 [Populus alba x Populus x berolinensis]